MYCFEVKGQNGLIWIDPTLYVTSSADKSELSALRLAEYEARTPDHEFEGDVEIRQDGAVPIIYAGLKYYLESGRCEVRTVGFDRRKDIDESAELVLRQLRAFAAEFPRRPLFLVAHSQGSLVARRGFATARQRDGPAPGESAHPLGAGVVRYVLGRVRHRRQP